MTPPAVMHALDALRLALSTGDPISAPLLPLESTASPSYPIWRFLSAWRHAAEHGHPLGADHAVLLRQIARWHGGELHVDELPAELRELGGRAGYYVTGTGLLRVRPYTPTWLDRDVLDPVRGIDGPPEARILREDVPGEAYLQSLSFDKWHSPVQKDAVWLGLTAPPRSTTLVALPTGAGKSLCFQMLARFSAGLTLVVVPTVALAIDQWRSAQRVFAAVPTVNPQYYAAGDADVSSDTVVDLIRDGQTRLLFTSPEACVSGRLRAALHGAASRGWLDALVIDEAHLVDTWGMEFRADFQVLSALRRQWLAAPDARVRTLLLSATFTPSCRDLLRALFADLGSPQQWREAVTQRLRPEMTYYVQQFDDPATRDRVLVECAWHLPRPAIIYTTEVTEAESVARRLREEGFRRVGCFHGNTRSHERRTLLDDWRADRLDVMVATSAFGMGVDKADVRTVMHACFPENLHRYYQEVGRGGRDGYSTVCVLLPTRRDEEIGASLTPRLMTPKKIQGRWEALWDTRHPEAEEHVWSLRLDAKPIWLVGGRTGRRNIDWNKRLLLQLLRAGLLELRDVRWGSTECPNPAAGKVGPAGRAEWATVRVNFPPTSSGVGELVEAVRADEVRTSWAGLQYLSDYLAGTWCIARSLRELYGREVVRTCGGCPADRREARPATACPPLPLEPSPRTSPQRVVVAGAPCPRNPQDEQRFIAHLRRIVRERGIRRFACAPALHERLLSLLGLAVRSDDPTIFYRVDPVGPDSPPTIRPDERVVLVHVGRIDRCLLALSVGAELVHLIASDIPLIDAHGRLPLEADGVPSFLTPEEWLRER